MVVKARNAENVFDWILDQQSTENRSHLRGVTQSIHDLLFVQCWSYEYESNTQPELKYLVK